MQVQVASVSTKGQVVIPGAIRSKLGITAGTRLVVITDGENVLMKPVRAPKLEEFGTLLEESRNAAETAGLAADSVKDVIAEARRARRR
jgi:AbrB family looped-hinge helix DNA binding protein